VLKPPKTTGHLRAVKPGVEGMTIVTLDTLADYPRVKILDGYAFMPNELSETPASCSPNRRRPG